MPLPPPEPGLPRDFAAAFDDLSDYVALMEVSPEPPAFRYLAMNRAAADRLGLTEEAAGRSVADLHGPAAAEFLAVRYAEASAAGGVVRYDDVLSTVRGRPAVEVTLRQLPAQPGRPRRVLWVGRDLTERQAAMAARLAAQRGEALVENSRDLICIVDADLRLRYAAPAMSRLIGRPVTVGATIHSTDVLHPDDTAAVGRALREARLGPGRTAQVQLRLRAADRSWRHIAGTVTNRLEDPAVRGLVTHGLDMTQHWRTQAMLDAHRGVLAAIASGARLQQVLETMVSRLQETLEGRAAVLLADEHGQVLRHVAGPDLPAEFAAALDGLPLRQAGQSTDSPLPSDTQVSEDIAADPGWLPLRSLALHHGVRACASTAIRSTHSTAVLGQLMVFFAEPRAIPDDELEPLHAAALFAQLAIDRSLERPEGDAVSDAPAATAGSVQSVPAAVWALLGRAENADPATAGGSPRARHGRRRGIGSAEPDPETVRSWARERGLPVAKFGRVPRPLLQLYLDEQPTPSTAASEPNDTSQDTHQNADDGDR